MNAIDRLRAERPDDFDVGSYDAALAAVDALYQAAKELVADSGVDDIDPRLSYVNVQMSRETLPALAAAVRRIEGEQPDVVVDGIENAWREGE